MPAETEDEHPMDNFSFSGWLKFNSLFFTEQIDGEVSPDNLTSDGESYTGGNPKSPDDGYRQTDLSTKLAHATDLSGSLANITDELYSYEYVDENWSEHEVYTEEGDVITGYEDNRKSVEIFWLYDDIMGFRAQKEVINEVGEDLFTDLPDDLRIAEVNFDFDFLLWLLYQWHENESLRTNLRLHAISDCKTVGKKNDDREVEIGGENEITRSVPFISAILDGNKIDELEGDFMLDSTHMVAKIWSEGIIHVKASRKDMLELKELKQMGRAVQFFIEIMRLYEEWAKLPSEDRYPPNEFFDTLIELCDEEGYKPKREPRELYDEYEDKRQGKRAGPMEHSTLNKFD